MSTGKIVCIAGPESDTGRDELYVVFNGVRVAKRGYPESPQARTWVSIEPGFAVYDGPIDPETGDGSLVIEHHGVPVH
jgi:hypothetical protein